jgi:hypothetical protein
VGLKVTDWVAQRVVRLLLHTFSLLTISLQYDADIILQGGGGGIMGIIFGHKKTPTGKEVPVGASRNDY